jgi:hypothetical protein
MRWPLTGLNNDCYQKALLPMAQQKALYPSAQTATNKRIPSSAVPIWSTGGDHVIAPPNGRLPRLEGKSRASSYGFVLGLICVALALVLASVMFTPAFVGGEFPLVGP